MINSGSITATACDSSAVTSVRATLNYQTVGPATKQIVEIP